VGFFGIHEVAYAEVFTRKILLLIPVWAKPLLVLTDLEPIPAELTQAEGSPPNSKVQSVLVSVWNREDFSQH
jgi:hypothetical protein